MTLDLLRLGDSPDEIRAALILKQTHNIRIRVMAEHVPKLVQAGFVESPESISCFINLTSIESACDRQTRKNLRASFQAWKRLNIDFTLTDIENFGVNRLINEVYFPLFVQQFYTRGISPYGAHNLETFKEFINPEMLLALAYKESKLIGAALLHRIDKPEPVVPILGISPEGPWVEGLIIAISDSHQEIRRAFLHVISTTLGQIGFRWQSLGRDLTWMGPRYCRVLIEKIRAAHSVAIVLRQHRYLHWWNSRLVAEDGLFFTWKEGLIGVMPLKNLTPPIKEVLNRLNLK